jgi:inosose dehydratase
MSLPLWAQTQKNLKIGHTGITWPSGNAGRGGRGGRGAAAEGGGAPAGAGPAAIDPGLAPAPAGPRPVNLEATEAIFRDVGGLGYHGLELFGWQVDGLEAAGQLGRLIEQYRLPLIGTYGGPNLTDPAQRQSSIAAIARTARTVKKHGGSVIVFGPNGVNRSNFVFAEHRDNIIATLNEGAKAVVDVGLTPVLHPHTGTCIETRDETYAVMENVDTRYLKFGPDVGQLAKGGADPVPIVRDFLEIVHHVHLKDFSGGDAYVGYCPLGEGEVDLLAIINMMEGRATEGMVMVELDRGQTMPQTPPETAAIAKAYLQAHGVGFRG